MAGGKQDCVLFISADQWRAECLSARGHPLVRTPHLDALAADGVLFERHFTQCTPCGPARASLLTGLYLMNHRSGRNGTPLDARHSNVALEARKAGYEPMLFGYSDSSPDPRGLAPDDPRLLTYEGVLPGFSIGCQLPESMDRWRESLAAKGYEVPEQPLDVYKPVGKSTAPDGSLRPKPLYRAEDSDSAFLAERVIDYLDRQGAEPWFVHAVFLRPHPPLIAPEPYNALYALDDIPRPRRLATVEEEAAQHPYLDYLFERQRKPGYMMGEQRDLQALPDREIAALRATYYSLITEVDAQIGRLVAYLKARGLYERTLIVFTVDHGELLGDHWLWGKEGYFDQAFHIPLIVRDPSPEGRTACGHRVAAFTEAIDIMPTILDWLGREVPVACDGVSLLPLVRGRTPRNWRREAHWEFDFREPATLAAERHFGLSGDQCNLAVLRGRRFKYVHFAALPPLLFDLQADPGETRNLAADPSHQGALAEAAQTMLSWRLTHAERTLANHLVGPHGLIERKGARVLSSAVGKVRGESWKREGSIG